MIRRILHLPHINIQNANALSSPFTVGFPAMTAWLGAVHALQRKINQSGLSEVRFNGVAIITHAMDLQTYKGVGDYVHSIVGTGNPLIPKKKRKKGEPWEQFERPAFIEEARCHLNVSLLIEYPAISKDDEETLINLVDHHLNATIKIAGGDILSFQSPKLYRLEDGNDDELRWLTRRLMPGYAIVDRRELMVEAMEQGSDAIDALLDYMAVHHTSERDDDGNVSWTSKRKTSGWIVPIATSFHGLTEPGLAMNQRDPDTPHRFAESAVTLGEFRMPHRIKSLDEILWHYHTEMEANLYLCQQNNRNDIN